MMPLTSWAAAVCVSPFRSTIIHFLRRIRELLTRHCLCLFYVKPITIAVLCVYSNWFVAKIASWWGPNESIPRNNTNHHIIMHHSAELKLIEKCSLCSIFICNTPNHRKVTLTSPILQYDTVTRAASSGYCRSRTPGFEPAGFKPQTRDICTVLDDVKLSSCIVS